MIVVVINSTKQSQDRSQSVRSKHDSAVERLRERYANGEINREEYQQMLEDLKE